MTKDIKFRRKVYILQKINVSELSVDLAYSKNTKLNYMSKRENTVWVHWLSNVIQEFSDDHRPY